MTTIIAERLAQIKTASLSRGAHPENEDLAFCGMEAVAYVAGETWNDALPSRVERGRLLKPLIRLIVDTRSTSAVESKRWFMDLDWLIRVYTPKWLDLVPGLKGRAVDLRALNPIVDVASAKVAGALISLVVGESNSEASGREFPPGVGLVDKDRQYLLRVVSGWSAGESAEWSARKWGEGLGEWNEEVGYIASKSLRSSQNVARVVMRESFEVSGSGVIGIEKLRLTATWLQGSALDLVKRMIEVEA